MKVFVSDVIYDEYIEYLGTKGFDDIVKINTASYQMSDFVKNIVAPTVTEYTINKVLTMCECFAGIGSGGGLYIGEQVGFTDDAHKIASGLEGSMFIPLTVGTIYKSLPTGKESVTNFFGPIDAFVYSAEFAKKFVENVDFRQPFDVIAMAMLASPPPFKFVPVAESVICGVDSLDKYDGYWSSFLRGYEPTALNYQTIRDEYEDYAKKKEAVEDYYKTTYGFQFYARDMRYVKERYESIVKEITPIKEQEEECESLSQEPQDS